MSFNSNGNVGEVSDPSSGAPPFSQNDCPIGILPDSDVPGNGPSQFADGASNASLIDLGGAVSSATCTKAFPEGYYTSSVRWGSTEKNAYSIFTAAFGVVIMPEGSSVALVPAGTMSTCTLLSNGLTGTLTNVVAPATAVSLKGATVSIPIKVASTSPATCDVEFAHTGVPSDGNCSLSITNSSGSVPGNAASAVYSNLQCSCISPAPADSITVPVTIMSNTCVLSGVTTHMITCRN